MKTEPEELLPTPQHLAERPKTRDWVGVYVMIAGFCLSSIGLILMSFWIGIAGVVVVVAAGLGLWANGVMAHTEPLSEGQRAYGDGSDDDVPRLKEETRVIPG